MTERYPVPFRGPQFTPEHKGQHEGGCPSCQIVTLRARVAELSKMLSKIVTGELEVVHHEVRDGKLDFVVAPPGTFTAVPLDKISLEDLYPAGTPSERFLQEYYGIFTEEQHDRP
jgi:hypothetical protein